MSIRITIAKWLAPERVDLDSALFVARKALAYQQALRNIASLRTPKCAHIGKRMADIAEAALSHSQAPSPNTPTPERETR